MSHKAVQAVLRNSKQVGTTKLALVCIAEHYNDKTGTAWPGTDLLASYCNVSQRNIFKVLDRLVEAKELEIEYKSGPFGVNLYRLPIINDGSQCTTVHSEPPFTVNPSSSDSEPQFTETMNPSSPKPLVEPLFKPLIKKREGAKRIDAEKLNPGPLASALLEICCQDFGFVSGNKKLNTAMINTLKLLDRKNATPELIREFDVWRVAHHWTRDGPPTLAQVGEFWGQFEKWVQAGRPAPEVIENGKDKQDDNLDQRQQPDPADVSPIVARLSKPGEYRY